MESGSIAENTTTFAHRGRVASLSYDLYMFAVDTGRPPMDQVEELDAAQQSAQPEVEVEARNRRVAEALLSAHPRYEEQQSDFGAIAQKQEISEDEARRRRRDTVLFDMEGIEVTLSDHVASLNFPYWDSLDIANIIERIEEAAIIVGRECPDWSLYDPQLDQVIDPADSREAIRQAFDYGRNKLHEAVAAHEASAAAEKDSKGKPSFWRKFFGRG